MLIPVSRQREESQILESVKKGNKIDHFKTVRLDKSGREISVCLSISPVRNSQGVVICASKITRDITDKQIAETRQAMLAAIVESSDDAIISKTLKGYITSWNKGAERIFGYTEKETIGKHITILIPAERLAEEEMIISNISRGKRVEHFETIRIDKYGREIPISLTISPIKDSQGNIIGASKIARDITEQVKSQELILKYTKDLETLNALGRGISEKMDVQLILQRVADATTRITGAAFGLSFYHTTGTLGESLMLYAISGASRKAFEESGMLHNTSVFNSAFSRQGIIRVNDITKDERYNYSAPDLGTSKEHLQVVSFMFVPVISTSGSAIGGLFFGHPEPGIFKAEHEDIISSVASQAAIAIENSRLFEEVRSLSAKKDEFIALASHELKTPLTSVKGYLQVLALDEHDKMGKKFLEKSLNQVNKLNTLVEDMLNMSRIEAGKLELNYETFNIIDLLRDVIETFQYTNPSHKIITEFTDFPVIVEADKHRIEQVFINLLGNAIKYSPKADRVLVTLCVCQETVTIGIKDYGIGLTEEQQSKIFSRFYRAEGNFGITGLGLGLYLTKQVIDLHKGNMKVVSEFGKGSEFYFTLPSKS